MGLQSLFSLVRSQAVSGWRVVLDFKGRFPLVPMAYIVLGAAFFTQMAFAGSHFSFGVFLKPLSEEFAWGRGATAFAYTLQWWISSPATILLGWLSDRIGTRKILFFGGLVFGLGIFMSSRIQHLWQFYLYFGVLAGIGRAAARAPLLRAVFQFFNSRKGLAIGITLSGTGMGTFLFPPLARYIISVIDWRAAFMVIGSISLLIILTAASVIRRPKPDELEAGAEQANPKAVNLDIDGIFGTPGQSWTVRQVLRQRVFWIFVVTGLACCISHSLPLAHIVAYATDRGIETLTAANILGLIGIFAAAGRLLWGAISDRIGARKTVAGCIALQTLMMFWVAFARESWAFHLFAISYGLSYGGYCPCMR